MKKLLASLILAGSFALTTLPASAEVDDATARSLMQETGAWDTLTQIPGSLVGGIQSGLAGAGGAVPPEFAQRMVQAAGESFTADRMHAAALGVMRKGLDATTVSDVRKWYATSLGKSLLALEKASSADTNQAKRMTDGQAALQQADEARRKALADIIEAAKVLDGVAEIQLSTAMAMMSGVAASNPALQGTLPSGDQLRSMLQGQMAAAKPQIQAALTANLANTYASASTADLQTYLVFLRSPAGAKFNELSMAALGVAAQDGAGEMGRKLSLPAKAPGTP